MPNILDGYLVLNRAVNQEQTFTELDLNKPYSRQEEFNPQLFSNSGFLFLSIGFLGLFWILLFLGQWNFFKSFRNKLIPIKRFQKMPCLHCQFFNSNPFVKCAVQPSKVLNPSAYDCADYLPQDETQ